ncbi:MAG: hypothetical protein RLZZ630_1488 [Bacteroidota bacterium]|jgi:dipeptidyl-peptidase-4
MRKAGITLLITLSSIVLYAQPGLLTIEDIWGSPKLFAHTTGGFRALNDGEHYTSLAETPQGNAIVRYSLKTGQPTDTILHPSALIRSGDTLEFSDYTFSPDEKRILLHVDPEAIYRHSSREDYWIFERNGNKLTRVTGKGKAMYGSFSPDGQKLAYVKDNNLLIFNIDSGDEFAVTTDGRRNEIINGATDWVYEEEFSMDVAYDWSADGTHLAYYRFDESRVKEFNLTYYGALYPKEERYKYPKAGEENSKVELHVFNLADRKDRTLFTTDSIWEYLPRVQWTNDPDLLSYQRSNRHQNILELVFHSISTGKERTVIHEQNNSFIEVTDDLYFMENGKSFAWSSTRDGYNHIYHYAMNGNLLSQVTRGSFEVTRIYGFDEKSGRFYFQSTEKSPLERHVYSIDLKGRKKLLTPEKGTHNATFSQGMKYFVNTHSAIGKPYTSTLRSIEGKVIRVLEDNLEIQKRLGEYRLGRTDTIGFTARDGMRIHGWIIYPPDFDSSKTYPVLMHVYGGPGVQTVTDDWDGPNYLWHQMLAQKGIIVASFDNRGTPGRGLDFANCIYKDMGGPEVLDQLDAVSFLRSKPWVDSGRIGVWGWSFGGYMTSLLLTKGGGVFKSGIAVAPVTTWRYYDSIYTERYLQTPQENPKGYDENSPINFAKNLKGNFLLVHGSTDDNVHMQNTMDFVTALVKANKPFEQFIYPNKNHGISGGATRLHLYTKMTDFLLKTL